ncbi:MAG TPA: flagellar hook-associated protein FlgK [Bryobacteraceae bacterium]|nr:flagellar hook-associated protein FlgK [Bryobacteraceae bacterium]
MGGLFAALDASGGALNVYSQALGAEQQNVANASTPGYAVQNVSIQPLGIPGNGLPAGDFIQISSPDAAFADAQVRAASSEASESQTQASTLSPVNQLFDITGTSGILAALQQFGTAFSSLATSPNDPALGNAALNAASNVALAFQSTAGSLATQETEVDSQIESTVSEINSLAARISQLNAQASGETEVDPATGASLRSTLDQLSSLVDINVETNPNGTVSVLAGGQLPLVLGDQAFTLTADPTAAAGSQITSSGGGNSPQTFSGQLGALLQVRNGTFGVLLGSGANAGTLNTLTSGFATNVNTLLTSGVTATGAAGVPLFTWDQANPHLAAATLAIDPTVTPSALGLASTGANGTANGIANQLAALPASNAAGDQIGGLSAESYFAAIAASIGQQLSDATNASTTAQTTLTAARNARQQQIGVSLDQEAVNVTADERAYQASAQVISVLNNLTLDTVNILTPTSS